MNQAAPEIDWNFSLDGKVALVTGGASGIGAAICKAFVRKGAAVAVADIKQGEAERQAIALGGVSAAFGCDVASRASVETLAREVIARFGRVDILVNSAGVVALAPAAPSLRKTSVAELLTLVPSGGWSTHR